jgi:hypothetical protein
MVKGRGKMCIIKYYTRTTILAYKTYENKRYTVNDLNKMVTVCDESNTENDSNV